MMKPLPTAGPRKNMEMAMLIMRVLRAIMRVIVKLTVVGRINRIPGWVVLPLNKLSGATQSRDAEI
ncbi:MAG: hypothetical protein EBU74_03945 [Betaproteobacteria bacterium]|nr:hypothetical protein [Betaproteobacteria bacterium]